MAAFSADVVKAAEGNKAAADRARKAFRKESIAELK